MPKEILVIDDQRERKIYLLRCSRRKLEGLLETAMRSRSIQTA
jgi:hypothetical protein